MAQILERPPNTQKSTGSRFYILGVSSLPTVYWEGQWWSKLKEYDKAFSSYEAAENEQPQAVEKAPLGTTVIISPELR